MNLDALNKIANAMVEPGRGILAADESTGTIKKRFDAIGVENTETNRNLARLYILQSLQLEPRIAEVEEVLVEQDQEHRVLVNVQLKVRPTDGTGTVVIGPFALEFES